MLDAIQAEHLPHDELAVHADADAAHSECAGVLEAADERRVLGDVVGVAADRTAYRRDLRSRWFEQHEAERSVAGVAARRTVAVEHVLGIRARQCSRRSHAPEGSQTRMRPHIWQTCTPAPWRSCCSICGGCTALQMPQLCAVTSDKPASPLAFRILSYIERTRESMPDSACSRLRFCSSTPARARSRSALSCRCCASRLSSARATRAFSASRWRVASSTRSIASSTCDSSVSMRSAIVTISVFRAWY